MRLKFALCPMRQHVWFHRFPFPPIWAIRLECTRYKMNIISFGINRRLWGGEGFWGQTAPFGRAPSTGFLLKPRHQPQRLCAHSSLLHLCWPIPALSPPGLRRQCPFGLVNTIGWWKSRDRVVRTCLPPLAAGRWEWTYKLFYFHKHVPKIWIACIGVRGGAGTFTITLHSLHITIHSYVIMAFAYSEYLPCE